MELHIDTTRRGETTVLHADGEIDLTTAPELRSSIERAQRATGHDVVLDLTAIDFIDSTGLSVLVDGARAARAGGNAFDVVADGHLRELLRITGLDTVMDVHRRLELVPSTQDAPTNEGTPAP